MFYPLLCTSLFDKNGNLVHHHRFLLHTKHKAWDKTLELMYSIFPNLKHLMLAIIHEVYRALMQLTIKQLYASHNRTACLEE